MFFNKRMRERVEAQRLREKQRAEDIDFLQDWARVMNENHDRAMRAAFPPLYGYNCRCVAEYICYVVGEFETVADAFNAGKTVRRVAWKPNVSGIVKLPNTRFVTLLLPNGTSKSWQPYAEDFAADDWYVV